ncbi:agmatine deiminase family protein [Pontibacter sp. MBLB2868]|uniref:agmatine deiminase family protein n=1 Tax=Pontibacter sp. MBLB2868 TaxID=3451555 RepID=UPI003F74ED0E
MIADLETNYLYLTETLEKKHSAFYEQLDISLKHHEIEFTKLAGTKDIWAVDFMPIQTKEYQFIQFIYNPDYLQSKKGQKTISNVDSLCEAIGIKPKKSNIILDGGNVVRTSDKVIMCSKVFTENPHISEKQLIRELIELFQVEKLIFIPTHPGDAIGHADGMVRFLDNDTVLINDLSKEKSAFQLSSRMALHNAGLEWIEIPYNPYNNKKTIQANGIYINYLQMKDFILVPTFGMREDEAVVKQFEELFRGSKIATIASNSIAEQGGVLNCITWNIKKD